MTPAPADMHDELDNLWRRVCETLRIEAGEQTFLAWIAPVRPVSADNDRVVLACNTTFERDKVLSQYGKRIEDLFALFSKQQREVDVVAENGAKPRLIFERHNDAAAWPGDSAISRPNLVQGSLPLDPRLTFANFVPGASNQTAFNVAQAVASGGQARINPLMIYGPTGLGKTHLLQATAWRLMEGDPSKRVLYLTSEAFMHGFLSSLRERDTQGFKDFVRNVDVFCFDDVQFLAGKTATVEEFFHTFDALFAHGKQIILSASVSPSLIEGLPERLKSRLVNAGGIEVASPDVDHRFAILQAKAKRRSAEKVGLRFGDDVLRMMAGRIQHDVRALEGALSRLVFMSADGCAEITFAKAQEWLEDFMHKHNKNVTLQEIKITVARHHGIAVADLANESRRRELVKARQIFMYLARVMTSRSYPEIGKSLSRDHTTCIYGFEKVRERCAIDAHFKTEVDAIQRSIRDWTNDSGDNNSNN